MPLCLISLPRTFSAQGPVSYLLSFSDLGVYIVIRFLSLSKYHVIKILTHNSH